MKITLQTTRGLWCWHIFACDRDEEDGLALSRGGSKDYETACREAFAAFERARKEAQS
jgi:hypothetical protein